MNQEHTDTGLNGFLSGLLIGSLLGAIAALWLAPQSGKRTQQMIRRYAHQLQRTAEDIKDSAVHASEDVQEKVAQAQHDGQEWLDHQTDQVNKTASKIRNAVAG